MIIQPQVSSSFPSISWISIMTHDHGCCGRIFSFQSHGLWILSFNICCCSSADRWYYTFPQKLLIKPSNLSFPENMTWIVSWRHMDWSAVWWFVGWVDFVGFMQLRIHETILQPCTSRVAISSDASSVQFMSISDYGRAWILIQRTLWWFPSMTYLDALWTFLMRMIKCRWVLQLK